MYAVGRSHWFPVCMCADSSCMNDLPDAQLVDPSQVTSADVPESLQHQLLDAGAVTSSKSRSASV